MPLYKIKIELPTWRELPSHVAKKIKIPSTERLFCPTDKHVLDPSTFYGSKASSGLKRFGAHWAQSAHYGSKVLAMAQKCWLRLKELVEAGSLGLKF